MTPYESKREARIERLRERAEKARAESAAAYRRSNAALEGIEPGQPVLVGHHSEKHHRRALDRAAAAMDKSCAEQDKARELERRAAAAESNTAISSDDPEALVKLAEKAGDLRAQQEFMKAVNAAHKRFLTDPASLDAAPFSDRAKESIRAYQPEFSWEPHPFPPYRLTNNRANLKRVEDRLRTLEQARQHAEEEDAEEQIGETRIVANAEANRTQIFFSGKPSEAVRAFLKSAGFRWSPSEGAWQRHLSPQAATLARDAARRAQEEEVPDASF